MVVVTDGSFAALELLWALCQMSRPAHIITRLRLDAQLYQPAPLRRPKQMGRPRKVGKRLPALKALVNNPYTPWQTVEMQDWYGRGDYPLHITSATAVWYKTGMPAVPIRWVLIKDPKGKFETQALLCTDLRPRQFKSCNGFGCDGRWKSLLRKPVLIYPAESQRQWSPQAIVRTTLRYSRCSQS